MTRIERYRTFRKMGLRPWLAFCAAPSALDCLIAGSVIGLLASLALGYFS